MLLSIGWKKESFLSGGVGVCAAVASIICVVVFGCEIGTGFVRSLPDNALVIFE